jgi:iron(III) transport system substrate-binding protein
MRKRVCRNDLSAWSCALLVLSGGPVCAQPQQDSTARVFQYQGSDREQRLLEGARKEGTLVLYTSLATSESVPLTQAFEKKYGVKVQLWRSVSENVLQRTVAEARAGRNAADVIETNGPELEALTREQLLAPFLSPYIADNDPAAVPSHRQWVGDRTEYFVVAFNTAQVRREEIPRTYEGFLDAKWQGRIALEANDEQWLGALINVWGKARAMEFFRKLAAMKPELRAGHILLAQLIVAGEVPVGLTAYGPNAEVLKRQGKPIDWAAVEPLVGRPQGIALLRRAPHPNAGLLFADFVLSPEGQRLLESMSRFPTSRNVKSVLSGTRAVMIDPAEVLAKQDEWRKTWNDLLRR